MITFATLVIAGDADSTGKGSSGAFGNGSGSGAGAVAVAAPPERRVSTGCFGAAADAGSAGGGAGVFAADGFGFRGVSHRSQRIPRAIAAPHMKHFWAMERSLDRGSYARFSCCCNVIGFAAVLEAQ
jgi:hypothetical protein